MNISEMYDDLETLQRETFDYFVNEANQQMVLFVTKLKRTGPQALLLPVLRSPAILLASSAGS